MRELKGRIGKLRAVAYSPDGSRLAAAGEAGVTKLWDVVSGRELAVMHEPGVDGRSPMDRRRVNRLAFSPDGKLLATATQFVRLWDASTGKEVPFPDEVGESRYLGIVFTPDGKRLIVTRSGKVGQQGAPYVLAWNRRTKKIEQPFVEADDVAEAVAISAAADLLAVSLGLTGNRVRLWGLKSKKEQATLQLPQMAFSFQSATVKGMAFSPDGRTLAVAGNWYAFVWDVPSRKLRASLRRDRTFGTETHAVAFSHDGRVLATASLDGLIRLYDVETLTMTAEHDWDVGPAWAVAFSPDGMTAAAVGEKSKVVIWDLE
jgi:WD40 repeat protein